jgi:hypothetical protein
MIYYYNSVYNLGGAPYYTANANGVAYAFSANTYNVTIPGPPGNISYTISDGYGNVIPATATIPVPIASMYYCEMRWEEKRSEKTKKKKEQVYRK